MQVAGGGGPVGPQCQVAQMVPFWGFITRLLISLNLFIHCIHVLLCTFLLYNLYFQRRLTATPEASCHCGHSIVVSKQETLVELKPVRADWKEKG